MIRLLVLTFICLLTLLGCRETPPIPPIVEEPELPASQFFLTAGSDTLYDVSYLACNRSPSVSEASGDDELLLLFSPGIFYDKEEMNIPDDIVFQFIFHDVAVQYLGSPNLEEFWLNLQQNTHEFNMPPYKRDFFLSMRKGEKVYQNWWNGNLVTLPLDISQDETGLQFKNDEFTRFEEFGDICLHDFKVLRLQGDITGNLVTEDYSDTLHVEGKLDAFLNFRE